MKKGYVQVYTGDGKGKTTAALGLALRAAGAGLKVYICQFMKIGDYSEIKSLKRFSDMISIEQFGIGKFVKGLPAPEDMAAARRGLEKARGAMESGQYGLIILEEANVAVHFGLFPVEELLNLIADKPEGVEIIITGRGARPEIIDRADLVTEMKSVKHYFDKGVAARTGIEK
ncbi:MAG: cob(I)yrinic acid a,c-diamide adenosyltransferase [Desulfobacterales bacterium]|nr:cob(I)yrinic acid a,c-diamide adenosyltransferase [Desulfobacterales bacterium]